MCSRIFDLGYMPSFFYLSISLGGPFRKFIFQVPTRAGCLEVWGMRLGSLPSDVDSPSAGGVCLCVQVLAIRLGCAKCRQSYLETRRDLAPS